MLLMLVLRIVPDMPRNWKKLTFEQVYLNQGEALLQPLPDIPGWLDDTRYHRNARRKNTAGRCPQRPFAGAAGPAGAQG